MEVHALGGGVRTRWTYTYSVEVHTLHAVKVHLLGGGAPRSTRC